MLSGGRYLIYETGAQGLVVAAMLERVGGKLIEIEDTDRVSLGKNIHLRLWFYKFDFETLINKIQGFPNGKNRKHDVFLEMYFGIHYSVEILILQVWFWKISLKYVVYLFGAFNITGDFKIYVQISIYWRKPNLAKLI